MKNFILLLSLVLSFQARFAFAQDAPMSLPPDEEEIQLLAMFPNIGEIQSGLVEIEVFKTIKEANPKGFKGMSIMIASYMKQMGLGMDELNSAAFTIFLHSLYPLLPEATPEAILSHTKNQIEILSYYKKTDPSRCYDLAHSIHYGIQMDRFDLPESLLIEYLRANTLVFTVVEPHHIPSKDEVSSSFDTILGDLKNEHNEGLELIKSETVTKETITSEQKEKYCAVKLAFFQKVIELPSKESIALLRYYYKERLRRVPLDEGKFDDTQLDKKLQEEYAFQYMKEINPSYYEFYLDMIMTVSHKQEYNLDQAKMFALVKIPKISSNTLALSADESILEFEQHYINGVSYSIKNKSYLNKNILKCYPFDLENFSTTGLSLELEKEATEATVKVITSVLYDKEIPLEEDVMHSLKSVKQELEKKYGEDVDEYFSGQYIPHEKRQRYCEIDLDYHEEIMKLPKDQSVPLLRYLYNSASPYE